MRSHTLRTIVSYDAFVLAQSRRMENLRSHTLSIIVPYVDVVLAKSRRTKALRVPLDSRRATAGRPRRGTGGRGRTDNMDINFNFVKLSNIYLN